MIQPNSIEWAECPHCNVLLNGWDYYPAHMITRNDFTYKPTSCPRCKKQIAVKMRVELKIEAISMEEDNEKATDSATTDSNRKSRTV